MNSARTYSLLGYVIFQQETTLSLTDQENHNSKAHHILANFVDCGKEMKLGKSYIP